MFPAGAGTTFGHRLFRVLPRLGMMGRGISGRLLFSAFRRRPPAGAESTRTIGRRWKEKGAVELLNNTVSGCIAEDYLCSCDVVFLLCHGVTEFIDNRCNKLNIGWQHMNSLAVNPLFHNLLTLTFVIRVLMNVTDAGGRSLK